MKTITLLSAFTIFVFCAQAQVPSVHENFDVDCASSGSIPYISGWQVYNPIATTIAYGQWVCTPVNGRPNTSGMPTPGIQCTDTFSSSYHLDTSFLITPLMDLSSYDSIFLQFDTKTDRIYYGADLSILVTTDTSHPYAGGINITDSLVPLIGIGDSTNWVTHVVNLTPFKSAPFYIAFRYTSTATTGSIWFLDNVNTTTTPITLYTANQDQDKAIVQLKILGNSTTDRVNFSYTASEEGIYKLAIFDMLGREVYDEHLNAASGANNYAIKGLDLHPGMYLLKMGNEHSFGVTKVMIQ